MIRSDNPDFKICIRCGERKTRDESGLCSLCRRRTHPQSLCTICGQRKTSDPSGVCARCRREHAGPTMRKIKETSNDLTKDYIDSLIQHGLDEITILRYYRDGRSAQEIGDALGMTRHQVNSTLRRLIGAKLFDAVPGDAAFPSAELDQKDKDEE